MKNRTISLKNYLGLLSHNELVTEAINLYNKFPQVRDYYQLCIKPQSSQEILKKYKSQIKKEFFPEREFRQARLSIARKPITDYKKVSSNNLNLIDLMLYYVEQGVKYTLAYGDINEPFYDSMESMYEDSLDLIKENNLYEQFHSRCEKIMTDTSDTGWGFGDYIKDLFKKYYKRQD